jgi:hypothetical protein
MRRAPAPPAHRGDGSRREGTEVPGVDRIVWSAGRRRAVRRDGGRSPAKPFHPSLPASGEPCHGAGGGGAAAVGPPRSGLRGTSVGFAMAQRIVGGGTRSSPDRVKDSGARSGTGL